MTWPEGNGPDLIVDDGGDATLLVHRGTAAAKNPTILDEPTDGFSRSQLSKIRPILQELHSNQIIIVSHEKELETYADNIFQITKENGISSVVKL